MQEVNNIKIAIKKLKYLWSNFEDKQNTSRHVQIVADNFLFYLIQKDQKYNTNKIKVIIKILSLCHDIGKLDEIFTKKILNQTQRFKRTQNIELLKRHVLQAPTFLIQYDLQKINIYKLILASSMLHHRIRSKNPYPSKNDIVELTTLSDQEKMFLIKIIDRIDELIKYFYPNKLIVDYILSKNNINIKGQKSYFDFLIKDLIPEYLLDLQKNQKSEHSLETEITSVLIIILNLIDIISSTNRSYQSKKSIHNPSIFINDLKIPRFLKKEFLKFLNTKSSLNINLLIK